MTSCRPASLAPFVHFVRIGCLLVAGIGLLATGADLPVPQVQAFDLAQVRLGPGPCKDAQDTDAAYLLKLEPDRLLAGFRREAHLPAKAQIYGGWEAQGVAGHTCGHYLSALAEMYAATGDPELVRRARSMVGELAACQAEIGTGYVGAIPGGDRIFAQIKAGIITTRGNLNGGWVPWYTLHKELAGLLDVAVLCHDEQALAVARRLGDWVADEIAGLSYAQMQQMLTIEHGGMAEALANLSALTGEPRYLALAIRFRDDHVFVPLSQGRDMLDGYHANTQIPKFIGYHRIYELTGNADYLSAADHFWTTVTANRSWVIGGNSIEEHFFPPAKSERAFADTVGPETCNSYNMLKLTAHLFAYHPSGALIDYYERTLYNHILASVRPHQDGFVYYTSLYPGSYRSYSSDFNDFWCCVGTGMENHALYGRLIYAHAGPDRLLVNLFIPSTLDWQEAGLRVEQRTTFPDEPSTTLIMHPHAPQRLEVDVRYPGWVAPGALRITVNGVAEAVTAQPGAYVPITRQWNDGDTIVVSLPMTIHTELLPHSSSYVAILYGPIVLAGRLGAEGLPNACFTGQRIDPHRLLRPAPTIVVPIAAIPDHCTVASGPGLHITTTGLMAPHAYELAPFYQVYNERYALYWQVTADPPQAP